MGIISVVVVAGVAALTAWGQDPAARVEPAAGTPSLAVVTPAAPAAARLPARVEALIETGTEAERIQAATWLATNPLPEAQLLPHLLRLVADPAPHVRRAAARALMIVPELGTEGAHTLVGLLEDVDACVRSLAAAGLGRDDARGDPQVVDALLTAACDATLDVRWTALEALASHYKDRPELIVRTWIDGLDDPCDDVKSISANCLEEVGPAARAAAPALETAMRKTRDPYLEWELSDALSSVVGRK